MSAARGNKEAINKLNKSPTNAIVLLQLTVSTVVEPTIPISCPSCRIVCYDLNKFPQVDQLQALAGRTHFVYHQTDVSKVEIEETDLLFIDTLHNYEQLKEEFRLHANKAKKYIVLHDTTTFGERGETNGCRGLRPAIEELLAQGNFRLKQRFENNHGLTVLERK